MVLSWELFFQEERNKSRKVDRHETDRRFADSYFILFHLVLYFIWLLHIFNLPLQFSFLFILIFILLFIDQRNEAGTMTGKQVRIEQIVVNEEGTMIVGAEIVIGIMIVIVDMSVSVTEILNIPEVMIQEVDADHVHGLGNAHMIGPGIMIVIGTCLP